MSLNKGQSNAVSVWFFEVLEVWDHFWFKPRSPQVLCVLRLLFGSMLLYSHVVLAMDLESFLGEHAWVDGASIRSAHDGTFGLSDWSRSYLWSIDSRAAIWSHHLLVIAVTFCFTIGLFSRLTAPLAWFFQVMYIHRLTGALFGLDQMLTYGAMYLMFTPCGSYLSVDAWLRRRYLRKTESSRLVNWLLPNSSPSVAANVVTRLFQLHLCVIYLFGGLSKARGQTWWDGTAAWYAIANYEYQSFDMTWLSKYPRCLAALSGMTLFWEISYSALVWPRLTRPVVLAFAVFVHLGIAIFLGMATFGFIMIAANVIFLEPHCVNALLRFFGFSQDPIGQDTVNKA